MRDGLDWWRDAIAGKKPPVTTTPECGFFVAKITLHRGKPDERIVWWPGSILWEGPVDENGDPCADQKMVCEIGGQICNADDQWLTLAKRPVTREEYSFWLDKLMENA